MRENFINPRVALRTSVKITNALLTWVTQVTGMQPHHTHRCTGTGAWAGSHRARDVCTPPCRLKVVKINVKIGGPFNGMWQTNLGTFRVRKEVGYKTHIYRFFVLFIMLCISQTDLSLHLKFEVHGACNQLQLFIVETIPLEWIFSVKKSKFFCNWKRNG